MIRLAMLLAALVAFPAVANPWRDAARALPERIDRSYAYPERLPRGRFALTAPLAARAKTVADARAFTRFAEDSLMLLADHHAITGRALGDSWALVPSYADLWIERDGQRHVVTDVRTGSPAWEAGLRAGQVLVEVDGVPTADAVAAFWSALGVATVDDMRAGFAARVLAAGRRDRVRRLGFAGPDGTVRMALASLYTRLAPVAPLTVSQTAAGVRIRFHDSLGDMATIAAFDDAMAAVPAGRSVILDLTDTPSGGNSTVARAIMGWFTDRPRPYQVHRAIAEERETGIPRQWTEDVLPRHGRQHRGVIAVRVGRWTGSMGEGMAIGLAGWGIDVAGRPMAGLRGAIADVATGPDGFQVKLPTERLVAVDGTPREDFRPRPPGPGEGD